MLVVSIDKSKYSIFKTEIEESIYICKSQLIEYDLSELDNLISLIYVSYLKEVYYYNIEAINKNSNDNKEKIDYFKNKKNIKKFLKIFQLSSEKEEYKEFIYMLNSREKIYKNNESNLNYLDELFMSTLVLINSLNILSGEYNLIKLDNKVKEINASIKLIFRWDKNPFRC